MIDKLIQIVGFGLGGILISMLCNVLLLNFSKSLGIRNKTTLLFVGVMSLNLRLEELAFMLYSFFRQLPIQSSFTMK